MSTIIPPQNHRPGFPAFLFVSLGLFVFAFAVALAVHSYTPLPVWDHWIFYLELMKRGGHFSLADLWTQHNEHRPVLLRLFCLADYAWFSGTSVFLYCSIFVGQLLNAALLVWLARRFAGWRGELLWIWAGLVTALLFTPVQRENFTWAWQICFITLLLSCTAAVAALLTHTDRWRTESSHPRWTLALAVAMLFGALSWLSLAAGLAVVVLLVLLAWWLALPRANVLALGLAAVAATLLYFWHYDAPLHHISPTVALTHYPARVLQFVLSYLGGATDLRVGPSVLLPEVTGLLGLAICSWAVWSSLRTRLRQGSEPPALFPAAMLFFSLLVLATAMTTSTARIVLNEDQHPISRYQSIAVFFWLGLAGYALHRWPTSARRRYGIAVATMALALFPFVTIRQMMGEEELWMRLRSKAAMAVASDVDETEVYAVIIPHGDDWTPWRIFVESRHLSLFANPYFRHHEDLVSVFHIPPNPALRTCTGAFDPASIKVVGHHPAGIFFTGWAWDQQQHKPIKELVVIDEHNRVAGYAETTVRRPDVPKALPYVTAELVGWQAYAPYSQLGKKVHLAGVENQTITCFATTDITLTPAP